MQNMTAKNHALYETLKLKRLTVRSLQEKIRRLETKRVATSSHQRLPSEVIVRPMRKSASAAAHSRFI